MLESIELSADESDKPETYVEFVAVPARSFRPRSAPKRKQNPQLSW